MKLKDVAVFGSVFAAALCAMAAASYSALPEAHDRFAEGFAFAAERPFAHLILWGMLIGLPLAAILGHFVEE